VPAGCTVLQACEVAGIEVPRFCYHDRLSIAGNCRMCLVEVEKSPKPVASCAMPIMPGMKIKTDTPMVRKAREGVMEFLLANHPLDCPICDQGGECDLQDQSVVFGSDRSRFREYKRTVEDKNLGPFVKTNMTRCIHCTRCVRFATEVAGVEDLGATGRGNAMEIGTYVPKYFDSELSGNIIDICPVGALTSKPYAFTARPWELDHVESVDVHDAVGSNIRIDIRGVEVMRVLPRLNEDINEEWLSDKSRFAYDGLKYQRLDTPFVRKQGQLVPVDWPQALRAVRQGLVGVKSSQMRAIAGDLMDAEALVALKDLFNRLGSNNLESRVDCPNVSPDLRSNYLFNSSIVGIEQADVILLIGCNPRMEAPIINARIRKTHVHAGTQVYSLGPKAFLTYPSTDLGNDPSTLEKIAAGQHNFNAVLKSAANPMVIVGASVFKRPDADAIQVALLQIAKSNPNLRTEEWNGLNVLHTAAARSAALDIGFVPSGDAARKPAKFVYLLGADDLQAYDIPPDAFIVYQGHHGDKGVSDAHVVLPGVAYTEKDGTYVNTEGRPQRGKKAVTTVGDAREDWKIIVALSEILGLGLPYTTLDEIRARMADIAPHLALVDQVQPTTFHTPQLQSSGKISSDPFAQTLKNFFMTDVITRSSRNMVKATSTLKKSANNYA